MAADLFPLLWLCGPGGIGKSTTAWQLFTELSDAGVPTAFADTDQFCMCYPAPPGDPGRQHVKALNVGAMIGNYRAAGARCLIANGVLDATGLRTELLPRAAVTICRLRTSTVELERRLAIRDGQQSSFADLLSVTMAEADEMDHSTFADACVDTTGVPEHAVAALVRRACPNWPGFTGTLPEEVSPASDGIGGDTGGNVMLITGPAGVGKSTSGFQAYLATLQAGRTAGYVDLDQIGFVRTPQIASGARNHELKARNLAAIWRNYRDAGATHLVATGPIEDEAAFRRYAGQLPDATVTLCRLRAGSDELASRILSRGAGGSWPQPGDPLRGQPPEVLSQAAALAAREAAALDEAALPGLIIDTDGRTPSEAADLIDGAATGWRTEPVPAD
ncbi:MAG TPA: hypothetical protein VGI58_03705 [Streptosporangiaceae bacterium]|jgi:adenylylsulfate kinase-like enzyme